MKLNGKKIQGPNIEYIVLPRGNGEDLIFKVQAVLSHKTFETLVSEPKPSYRLLPGGKKEEDRTSPEFKGISEDYNKKRSNFVILESLRATEGLEWETVIYDDPSTWHLWESELRESGLTNSEIMIIMQGVASVNALNQDKIDEARSRFLASLTQPKD